MKINYKSIPALTSEFEEVAISMWKHHSAMDEYLDYYQNNVFYAPKAGTNYVQSPVSINLLKVFADKNIDYTSGFPDIKTITSSPDNFERQRAGTREKIVLATHKQNNSPLLQKKWAFDGTVLSRAVAITEFDLKQRCVTIRRVDPRYCYLQYANDNDTKLVAFWEAYPMTSDQIERTYGIKPKNNAIDLSTFTRSTLQKMDGKDWFLVIRRHDDQVSVAWVGDQYIQAPHYHKLGVIPVDIAEPLTEGRIDHQPEFFIRPLISPQAEYNETIRRISNIARKLGNPAVWGRGIVARQFEDVKSALRGDGGFIGMKGDGELGILQVPETKMLDAYLDRLMDAMQRISSFGNASFGESVGANTSGDALSMYFQPTTRRVEHQNIGWISMYEGINSKTLKYYDTFLRTDERKQLSGYIPQGTVQGISAPKGGKPNEYTVGFGKQDIAGNYGTVVRMNPVTPKDEIAYKRLMGDLAGNNVISRTTAYEEFGLQNPEDEFAKLEAEMASENINSEGALQRAQADQTLIPDEGAKDGPNSPAKIPAS